MAVIQASSGSAAATAAATAAACAGTGGGLGAPGLATSATKPIASIAASSQSTRAAVSFIRGDAGALPGTCSAVTVNEASIAWSSWVAMRSVWRMPRSSTSIRGVACSVAPSSAIRTRQGPEAVMRTPMR